MNPPESEPNLQTAEPDEHADGSLRGTFVSVLLLGAFLVACWVGVLAIVMERR